MRIEALFLIGIAVFFGIVGIVYWFWSYEAESGGTMMLGGHHASSGCCPGSYYLWWSRRMKPRPRTARRLHRRAGPVSSAPSPASSIWPFVLGMGLFLIVLSLVFGLWLLAPGRPSSSRLPSA